MNSRELYLSTAAMVRVRGEMRRKRMDSFGEPAMVMKVIKADGDVEEYFHTKVLLCIANALCAVQEWDTGLAQELANAVTAFIYDHKRQHIRSGDILSMVKVVLAETGFEEAAASLDEHHRRRTLARRRTELVDAEVCEPGDAEAMRAAEHATQWSKGLIAGHIARTYDLDRHCARAAAARVEERVLAMGLSRVWSGLVRQIIVAEADLTMRAEESLRQACQGPRIAVGSVPKRRAIPTHRISAAAQVVAAGT